MKPHHSRALSASQKKNSNSYDVSPITSANARKENNNIFQSSEPNQTYKYLGNNNSRGNDLKLLSTNVFINNLNIQVKPQHSQAKAPLTGSSLANSAKRPSSKSGLPTNYSGEETKDRTSTNNSYFHADEKQQKSTQHQNLNHTPNGSKRDLASLLQRNPEESKLNSIFETKGKPSYGLSNLMSQLHQSDYSAKYNYKSPAKIYAPVEEANKKKAHIKNQKSLDTNFISPGMAKKTNSFQSSYSKPPTAENSPKYKEERRNSKNEIPTHGKPLRTPIQDKSSASSKPSITNSVQSRHKKAPSMDAKAQSDVYMQVIKKIHSEFKKTSGNVSLLDRVRKSADYGDSRATTNLSTIEQYNPKPQIKYAIRTRAGVQHNGMRKINQDSFIAHSNFGKKKDRYYFGVCDGHGVNGHFVSGFVKETLPVYILADPGFESDPKTSLKNGYELCQQKLLVCDFDCKFSGTTCVTMLMDGNKIITANAGDSRIIMAQHRRDGWDYISLSNDHKPNSIAEAQRILRAGGRIEPFKDGEGNYVGPSRVWLMNQDIPGLAMSRSIGDIVASTVGVSSQPEIKEFRINPEDKFIVAASDGVWEFINNIDVVKLIAPYYEQNNIEGACDALMTLSVKKWQEEEENIVDDITLIIIFL